MYEAEGEDNGGYGGDAYGEERESEGDGEGGDGYGYGYIGAEGGFEGDGELMGPSGELK